jgi:uncharacterized protein YbjT (DUF2867 family)
MTWMARSDASYRQEVVMFVITGATGQTGSVVARTLLERGKPVRVVVRDAARARELRDLGAEVAVASVEDPESLQAAFRGADAAYLMIPPEYGSPDILARYRRVVDVYAQLARPAQVVLLSSVGAQRASGNGPIAGLHYAEKKLTPDASLRAAYFMDNWAGLVPVAREQSILPASLTAQRRIPMVASEDIGRVAAGLLVEKHKGVVELAGPADYSPADVAQSLSRIFGREIKTADVPEAAIAPSLEAIGFSQDVADKFREMTVALNRGEIDWVGTPLRGRVTLDEKLRKLTA